jgi:hypothetical protein
MKALRLLLVSAFILFFELALIRYLGTELPSVGFFKNLILIACFLGLGVGLNLRTQVRTALLLLSVSALLPFLVVRGAVASGVVSTFGGFGDEAVLVHTMGQEHMWMGILLVCVAFAATATPYVWLGRLLGTYVDAFERPLQAYGWDLLGSLIGTVSFSAICFLSVPPWI